MAEAAHQILLMAGLEGLLLSLKGKRPVSSWCAMTPADHTSEAGSTADLSTSGAMNLQGERKSLHLLVAVLSKLQSTQSKLFHPAHVGQHAYLTEDW